jgi:hypothetical protein
MAERFSADSRLETRPWAWRMGRLASPLSTASATKHATDPPLKSAIEFRRRAQRAVGSESPTSSRKRVTDWTPNSSLVIAMVPVVDPSKTHCHRRT